jgi:serine/threonine protein kinase
VSVTLGSEIFQRSRAESYMWGSGEFFADVGTRLPDPEFFDIVEAALNPDWSLERYGVWTRATYPGASFPEQGWKIHVSAALTNASRILARAAVVLGRHRVPFKFASDASFLRAFNGKGTARGSAGKFIAAYPRADAFRVVIDDLADELDGLAGPYILSDRRHPSSGCVFYRYGQFQTSPSRDSIGVPLSLLNAPDGSRVPDQRQAYFVCPPWEADPFPAEPDSAEVTNFLARYRVRKALAFSNSGGVYRAVQGRRGRHVVLKEARPHVSYPLGAGDAQCALGKEFEILQHLHRAGQPVPEPIEFASVWEHTFSVMTFVDGTPLGLYAIANSPALNATPNTWSDYLTRIETVWARAAEFVGECHQRDLVLGDLSINNVLVDDELPSRPLTFIDFEAAVRIGSDEDLGIFTTPFTSPQRLRREPIAVTDDLYSLGAVLLGTIAFGPAHGPYSAETLIKVIDRIFATCPLNRKALDLVAALLDPEPLNRPSARVVAEELDRHGIRSGSRRSRPDAEATSTECPAVSEICKDLGRFIATSATPGDEWLYPADPGGRICQAPMSLAYGASGVIRALTIAGQPLPEEQAAWWLDRASRTQDGPTGLYTGTSGVAWALADSGHVDLAQERLAEATDLARDLDDPTVFSGWAGIGLSQLFMYERTGDASWLDAAVTAANRTRALVASRSSSFDSGYPFGRAGLAQLHCELHRLTGEGNFLSICRELLIDDGSMERGPDGRLRGIARPLPGGARRVSPYWLDGSAGVASVFARVYSVTGNPTDLLTVLDVAESIKPNAVFLSGLFTGLSGLGNALLDCYQATGQAELLTAAHDTAKAIWPYLIRRSAGLAALGEQNVRLSCDFATGSAGVLMFLHRLASGGHTIDAVPYGRAPIGAGIVREDLG